MIRGGGHRNLHNDETAPEVPGPCRRRLPSRAQRASNNRMRGRVSVVGRCRPASELEAM